MKSKSCWILERMTWKEQAKKNKQFSIEIAQQKESKSRVDGWVDTLSPTSNHPASVLNFTNGYAVKLCYFCPLLKSLLFNLYFYLLLNILFKAYLYHNEKHMYIYLHLKQNYAIHKYKLVISYQITSRFISHMHPLSCLWEHNSWKPVSVQYSNEWTPDSDRNTKMTL